MTRQDKTIKPDAPVVTAGDIRAKRLLVATRLLLRGLMTDELGAAESRGLYAMNLRGDLSEEERANVAFTFLETFSPDIAEALCQQWFKGAGFPGASLMENPVSDARFWSDGANPKEIDAYAMACFKRMSATRQKQFLEWAQKKVQEG